MNQNVTLQINSTLLEQATAYARSMGTDLSGLVEGFLRRITKDKSVDKIRTIDDLDPRVRSLIGVVHLDEEVGLNGEKARAEQYFSALAIKADVIITRDKKHFKHSTIPVMDADQYLQGVSGTEQ